MNNYPTIKIRFDRRLQANITKEGSVDLEIYFRAKRKWIFTGVKILPKHWNEKNNTVVGRTDSTDLNMRIQNIHKVITSYINKLIVDSQPFTWGGLENLLKNKSEKDSFINFVNKLVNERKDICEGTRRNHKKFHKALIDFNIIRDFKDLTRQNIVAYDDWLHSKQIMQTTVACYHKYMKIYINEAIRRELITRNPYKGMKIEAGKSEKRKFLTKEELSKLQKAKLPTDALEKVRDLFLFQTFTGLAYADMKKFDFKNVIERNRRLVLLDRRKKTNEDCYIVLLPQAIQILKKYSYVLPLMTNEQYNLRLKIIADAAGIEKRLTSHMGRHTYATLCLNSGIPIEILAKMMGHSDIKTTQIYAHLVNSTVEKAYEDLEKKLSDL